MDVDQLRQDVAEGRIDLDRLIDLVVSQQKLIGRLQDLEEEIIGRPCGDPASAIENCLIHDVVGEGVGEGEHLLRLAGWVGTVDRTVAIVVERIGASGISDWTFRGARVHLRIGVIAIRNRQRTGGKAVPVQVESLIGAAVTVVVEVVADLG